MTNTAKLSDRIDSLSEDARKALLATPASRRGARVPGTELAGGDALHFELRDAGFIARGGGLTDSGVSARKALVTAALDAAF